MSACPPLSYSNVTPAKWEALKAAVLAKYGVAIEAVGQHSALGLDFEWVYSGYETLTISCTDSGWFSCEMVNAEIDSLVKEVLAA